ncbi:hypothetical protein ACX1HF_19460 [Yersinia pseudotuberculosis]
MNNIEELICQSRIKEISHGSSPLIGEKERLALTAMYWHQEHQAAVEAFQETGRNLLLAQEQITGLIAQQKRGDDIDENRKVACELYQNTANRLEEANEKLSKPVVLPEPTAHLIWRMGGSGPDDYYEIIEISHDKDDLCFDGSPRCPVCTGWEIIEAIKAAGFTVEGK